MVLFMTLACSDYKLRGETDAGAPHDSGLVGSDTGSHNDDDVCETLEASAYEVGVGDHCIEHEGSFTPIVEWESTGSGCTALPVVGDLDGDGIPEILVNKSSLSFPGVIHALHGDGSGELWQAAVDIPYGGSPAIGDVDDDGIPEVATAREYAQSLFADGDYTVLLLDNEGNQIWESDHFMGLDFDWTAAPIFSDMDHDGTPEIIVGRVILDSLTGETRGVGEYGHGSYGITMLGDFFIAEGSASAVTDLDLDGQEEVIVGNAIYDVNGTAIWSDPNGFDGMIAVGNLDADPEGEFVAITGNTFRAHDTDGSILWGPNTIPSGNILSVPAIGDLDLDGSPEIILAGGNELWTLHADGSLMWKTNVKDESGATGASIFDFEGDGSPEVVYIDEIEMAVYDGLTGALKFYSSEHASGTMMDYPVIADVDADDQAEIVVCHDGYSSAMSVYGDADESWPPVRKLWNQHAYSISNINDDFSIPVTATPGFSATNTWHAAIGTDAFSLGADLEAEIVEVCEDDCDVGTVHVMTRLHNKGVEEIPAGVNVALYGFDGAYRYVLGTATTDAAVPSGWSSEGIEFTVVADSLASMETLTLVVDDDGTGTGAIAECSESNNDFNVTGPFCAE
ncbi:MAG: VCBS repeat-containing protein [Proteobacteria bacterium]|nr:VCBS repeat-containing protein [Pseudomonadota bacterium]MCP4921154.1 VCBS repeat-containing protein [Pseudomonadota bacterium]